MMEEINERVFGIYRKWAGFLEEKLTVSHSTSRIHNRSHMKRVMVYALLLGDRYGFEDDEMIRLAHASIFHDTRRQDDGLDRGHGLRAANYYKDYTDAEGLWTFDPVTYWTIAYHDLDDQDGRLFFERMESVKPGARLTYQIFKDSDGLDRHRLGPRGLNPDFLRTSHAHDLIDFARRLVEMGDLE